MKPFFRSKISDSSIYDSDSDDEFNNLSLASITSQRSLKTIIRKGDKDLFPYEPFFFNENAEKLLAINQETILNLDTLYDVEKFGDDIGKIWDNPDVQNFYFSTGFRGEDNFEHYLNSIERISQLRYIPTNFDLLSSRIKTIGIAEENYIFKEFKITTIDVGGTRNERRKWIHTYPNSCGIIYTISLLDISRFLYEDKKILRVDDSILLFENTINNPNLEHLPFVILFTSVDLLDRELRYFDITSNPFFKKFKGNRFNVLEVSEFVKDRFFDRIENFEQKKIRSYFIDLLDTEMVKQLLGCILGQTLVSVDSRKISYRSLNRKNPDFFRYSFMKFIDVEINCLE
eukprot:gene8590-415_t